MSVGFGFSLPALAQYGGGGNNPFGQLGPTLDLSFAGTVTDTGDPNGYTLNTNFIAPQYQVAADYTIWETNVGLVSKTFGDIITFTRASSATFTGSNGLIQSATTNTPRFDYDPVTLAAKGLLIEEQRVNLLTYSEQLDNAAWSLTASAVTISPDATTSPDGTVNADKIVSTVATSYGPRTPNFTGTAAAYTISVYAKAAGFNYVKLVWSSSLNATDYAVFNLSTGTVTGGVYTSATISNQGNGWYRCTLTSTLAAATSYGSVWMSDGTLTRSSGVAGDGTSGIFAWGAQVELGAFATSYIPTVASQVTRSADVASVNTLSPWYNATEGTLYASVSGFSVGPISSALASITDNPTASNWILISGLSTTAAGVVSGGASQANLTSLPSVSSGGSVAIAYKANDFAAVVNGGTVATDVSGSVPSSVSVLRIGGFGSNPGPLNGHLRRITYYPRRLSNAELQAITA